jgi:hypothetical protein
VFKTLVAWRSDAHKPKTQAQLSSGYTTVNERYKAGSGKNKSNKRLASADSSGGDGRQSSSNRDSTSDGDGAQGSGGEFRTRVRLQKLRRVITERRA